MRQRANRALPQYEQSGEQGSADQQVGGGFGDEGDGRLEIDAGGVGEVVEVDGQVVLADLKLAGVRCGEHRGRVGEVACILDERLAAEDDAVEDTRRDIVGKYRQRQLGTGETSGQGKSDTKQHVGVLEAKAGAVKREPLGSRDHAIVGIRRYDRGGAIGSAAVGGNLNERVG